jgi:ribose-phosphate pyrophosphokinase
MMADEFLVLGGTANPALASAVADNLGMPLGALRVERFPDGEVLIEIHETVRGKEVFLVQPTAPPVDPNLMELLALTDACRRAAAARIVTVIPYFGYARADKRVCRREPVTARMVADLLQTVGTQQVVTLDLHTPQIDGFFTIPVDSLTAIPAMCNALKKRLPGNAVTVAPDAGRARMATEYAHRLGTPVVILHKRRSSGSETETETIQLVGDVRGRACLIVDDMITTGGTIAGSIKALLEAGARPEIWVAATHGLFVGGARARLAHHAIREIWVTDTVAHDQQGWPQLHIVSVAPLLADALRQIHADGSLREMC